MPPGTKNYPGGEFVAITPSFSTAHAAIYAAVQALPASMRRKFNEQLPPTPRGIYIGGASGEVYDLSLRTSGGFIVPVVGIVPGVVHPIFPYTEIVDIEGNRTSAINILVVY